MGGLLTPDIKGVDPEVLTLLQARFIPKFKRIWHPWEIRCATPDINGNQTMYRYLCSGALNPFTDVLEAHGCQAITWCVIVGASNVNESITPSITPYFFSSIYENGVYGGQPLKGLGGAQTKGAGQLLVFDSQNVTGSSTGYAALEMPLLWSILFKAGFTQAAGTTTIAGPPGAVTALTIGTVGVGYLFAPQIGFTGGGGPIGTCTMQQGGVASVAVTGGTTLWTVAPTVIFTGGGGSGASAHCTVVGGTLAVVVDSPGWGYTSAPTVGFQGGTTTNIGGAAAHVTVTNGLVNSPGVVDAGGGGYTSAPTVVMGPPNAVLPITVTAIGR